MTAAHRPLVFAEGRGGAPTPESLFALEKARAIGGTVDALLTSPASGEVVSALAAAGVARTFALRGVQLAGELSQPYVDAIAGLVQRGGYDTVIFPGSVLALNVAAGLSARLEAGVNWGVIDLRDELGELVGLQRALDDTFVVECGWSTPARLAVLRGTATAELPAGAQATAELPAGDPATAELLDVELREWSRRLEVREEARDWVGVASTFGNAEVIVAGGRGVGGPDGFRLLEELADALGGTVAATLPVVEAGWYSRAALVGQSGSAVSPRVYVALGISGAVQHKVGVKGASLIVAVNTDPGAPIFRWCDIGIVGELQAVLPRVLELVRAGPPWS